MRTREFREREVMGSLVGKDQCFELALMYVLILFVIKIPTRYVEFNEQNKVMSKIDPET